MKKNIAEKQKRVTRLKELINTNLLTVLTDYRGISVAEITELRKRLHKENAEYHIVKNSLLKRATTGTELERLDKYLNAPTAVIFSPSLNIMKILFNFYSDYKRPEIKCGAVENRILNIEDMRRLVSLPSKEILLAQVIGTMKMPISKFVNILSTPIRQLVYVLSAISEKKDKQ